MSTTGALRRSAERNLAEIMDSEAGKRCVSCAHVKHNDLGYCQVGQCSCAIGTSIAGAASVVLRDVTVLLDRQAAEVARLRAALAKVATVTYEDHQGFDEQDEIITTVQRRGTSLERISEVILDVDGTLFDDPDAIAWFGALKGATT